MALDPVTALLDVGGKLIDRVLPDKAATDAAKLELLKLQQSGELQAIAGQLEVNKAEASNASVFVSGWRPAIGWVTSLALFYTYLLYPVSLWLLAIFAPGATPPKLGTDEMLYQLMFGMLGLGGLRTYEKVKGVAS